MPYVEQSGALTSLSYSLCKYGHTFRGHPIENQMPTLGIRNWKWQQRRTLLIYANVEHVMPSLSRTSRIPASQIGILYEQIHLEVQLKQHRPGRFPFTLKKKSHTEWIFHKYHVPSNRTAMEISLNSNKKVNFQVRTEAKVLQLYCIAFYYPAGLLHFSI